MVYPIQIEYGQKMVKEVSDMVNMKWGVNQINRIITRKLGLMIRLKMFYKGCRNEKTGEISYKKIISISKTPNVQILELEFKDEYGHTEIIKTTGNHPFFLDHLILRCLY